MNTETKPLVIFVFFSAATGGCNSSPTLPDEKDVDEYKVPIVDLIQLIRPLRGKGHRLVGLHHNNRVFELEYRPLIDEPKVEQ